MDKYIQENNRLMIKQLREDAIGFYSQNGVNKTDFRPATVKVLAKVSKDERGLVFNLSKSSIQSNGIAINNVELFIEPQHAFVATAVAVGLQFVPNFTIGTKVVQGFGNKEIVFYPDPTFFNLAASATAPSQADALEMIYNGVMSMSSNTHLRLIKQSMVDYRIVPTTQKTAVAKNGYDGVPYRDITVTSLFVGGTDNNVEIKFPDGLYSSIEGDTAAGTTYAVLLLTGVRIENASKYKKLLQSMVSNNETLSFDQAA